MVFSSTVFLFIFLSILIILYYLPFKGRFRDGWRNGVLLVFSLGFYAWGEPVFVFIMMASIVINWGLTLVMAREGSRKKLWLVITVVFDILLLVVFKYTSFILKTVTGNENLVVDIALPIGISFFTFQMMSYVFDVYYGKSKAQKNLFYVGIYISMFAQMTQGPIVRYENVEPDLKTRNVTLDDFSIGVKRFIYGLAKKVLLANFLGQIADNIFDFGTPSSVLTAWLGAIAYTLQIYFDFSGYSDMAIGLGRMFGFHFLENFNYPYIADSVTEFWHRWHISLSTWFRDYVYIPMGGNRVSRPRWILNLLVVWLLTGIWHGANWTFILWGLIYFVFLLIEKLTGFAKKIGWASHIYTLLIVILAWVFFRSTDIASGAGFVGSMFGIGTSAFADSAFVEILGGSFVVLIISCIAVTPLLSNIFGKLKEKKLAWIESIWLGLLFVLCILEVVCATYNPFLYFNF